MTVWDSLVGQPEAVEALREAAADPSGVGHAWLLVGPPGSGRSVAARAFAAALQCPDHGCGTCATCHQVLAGTHLDVSVFTTETLTLKTEATRDLVRAVSFGVVGGGRRVVIVEDADRLHESASNALLKVIEEPPAGSVWVLCAPSEEKPASSQTGIPITIRSRCRVVRLRQPDPAAVAAHLVREGVDPSMAAWAASAAQGHVGRARRLARDEPTRRRRSEVLALPTRLRSVGAAVVAAGELVATIDEEVEAVAAPMLEADIAAARELHGAGLKGIAQKGASKAVKDVEKEHKGRVTRLRRDIVDVCLTDLAGWYRDVLAHQLGSELSPINADQTAQVAKLATMSTPEQTIRRIEAVLACREAIAANVPPLLAAEAMAVSLMSA